MKKRQNGTVIMVGLNGVMGAGPGERPGVKP
jgi:hypothetical protein